MIVWSSMAQKFDIFVLLNEIKNNNHDFYDSLDEDDKKTVSPYVLMLWARGINTNNTLHTILLNELVNPYMFPLQKHPSLLWKLLCEASYEDKSAKFHWVKKGRDNQRHPLSTKLLMRHYGYNEYHAQDALTLFDLSDILALAGEYGYEKVELDKIKKEHTEKT